MNKNKNFKRLAKQTILFAMDYVKEDLSATIEYESGIKVMQMIEDAFTVIPAERKDYADN